MPSILTIVRNIIFFIAGALGLITVSGVFFAALGGQDSLAGQAITLFVNDFWNNEFEQSSIFITLIVIQFFLGLSLTLLFLTNALKVLYLYRLIFVVTFLVSSMLLDIARIGFTFEYALILIAKYLFYLFLICLVFISNNRKFQ